MLMYVRLSFLHHFKVLQRDLNIIQLFLQLRIVKPQVQLPLHRLNDFYRLQLLLQLLQAPYLVLPSRFLNNIIEVLKRLLIDLVDVVVDLPQVSQAIFLIEVGKCFRH